MSQVERAPTPDYVDPPATSEPNPDFEPPSDPLRKSSEEAASDPPKTGVLSQPSGENPNVPAPMVQEGAPD